MISIMITCDTCGHELKLGPSKPEALEVYQRSGGMVSPFTGVAACAGCVTEIRSQHPAGRNLLNS